MSKLQVLRDKLTELSTERRVKYPESIVVEVLPDVRLFDCPVWFGFNSLSIPSLGKRYMRKQAVVNVGYGKQTVTEVGRDYLRAMYKTRRIKATRYQAVYFRNRKSAPLYCDPGYFKDAAYVDLSKSYWSIMDLVGWDVDYNPGKWLIPGTPPTGFPLVSNKPARNSLVSAGLPSKAILWDGSKFIHLNTGNSLINLSLWTIIQDIQHTIARQALDLGALWVHTDGAILPNKNADELIKRIEFLHLKATVKAEGIGIVRGQGQYLVGDRRTTYVNHAENWSNTVSGVSYEWLVDTLDKCYSYQEKRYDTYVKPEDLYKQTVDSMLMD